MKNLSNNKNLVKRRLVSYLAALVCLFFGSLQSAQAQSLVTFAQFIEKNGSQDFVFTNNAANAAFNTVGGGSPIDFRYSNINGLNPALQGFQNAHLYLSSATSQPATVNGGTLTQSFNNTVNTIQIIRDTPAPVGVGLGSRTNLLTITYSPNAASPSQAGASGGNSASFSATTPDHTVTFTSDFLSFTASTQRNLALSFSSILPALAVDAGGFLRSFTAAGSGTFASNPAPLVMGPTAASVTLGGRVLTPAGRGLRNALITLTEADGSTRTVLTRNLGYYSFGNLTAGQTVMLTVQSKRYRFFPQMVTPMEDLNEVNFTIK